MKEVTILTMTVRTCIPGGSAPPSEIDCILVDKVYDSCIQTTTVPLVCADFVCPGPITSASTNIVSTTCSFYSSVPSASPNLVSATFLVTTAIEFTIVTPTTTCYTSTTVTVPQTVTLVGPVGTVQSCSVLSASTASPFVRGQTVFTSLTLCAAFLSTAVVNLLVPSYGFCTPPSCPVAQLPLSMGEPPQNVVQPLLALGTVVRQASIVQGPVPLGTAASFGVLAGSTVTNTGPSVISGNLGLSPGTAVTGFPPGIVTGTIDIADTAAATAQADLTAAYNNAASRTPSIPVTANLGGQILGPGVYSGGALAITGTLTLDGQGNPNAVFVFQAASTLITSSASVVSLVGGANACNVFWQVGSSATLGTASVFAGTIMALTSITADTGATVTGRLLARNGAVTLDSNIITVVACAPPASCAAQLSTAG